MYAIVSLKSLWIKHRHFYKFIFVKFTLIYFRQRKIILKFKEGRREEGSGWGTQVYLWRIHFDIWQN